jgi:hypothetical protein
MVQLKVTPIAGGLHVEALDWGGPTVLTFIFGQSEVVHTMHRRAQNFFLRSSTQVLVMADGYSKSFATLDGDVVWPAPSSADKARWLEAFQRLMEVSVTELT